MPSHLLSERGKRKTAKKASRNSKGSSPAKRRAGGKVTKTKARGTSHRK